MSTPATGPRLGPLGWARWGWRQLTSMRTALLLLLLLALAAVPGSIWPQRSVDAVRVRDYLVENPTLGPWLDRLGVFEVYSSPWFAAIYLLLMVSLVGCVVPRSRQHWHALRAAPPPAPRRPDRLPVHREVTVAADPQVLASAARSVLAARRLRLRAADPADPGAVSAEGGYLRETGNLVFHLSLLGVIVSMAVGHLWGWRAEVIVPEGGGFTSVVGRYDTIETGPWVEESALPPFGVRLDSLSVTFETEAGGAQFGAPRDFRAEVTTTAEPGAEPREQVLRVNAPLSFSGTSVYLLGNGYAPVVTVRDSDGDVVYQQPTPFLPQDDFYASTGAVKVPAADPGLGFYGAFLPTLRFDETLGPISEFPGLVDPALVLGVYEGDLFPQGRPQSVYTLDVARMEQVLTADGEPARVLLRPGETYQLPGERGSITLEEVVRWGGLVARYDPGRVPVLVCSVVLLGALVAMLTVPRRRVFVRVGWIAPPGADPDPSANGAPRHTGLVVAGLAKGADPRLQETIDRLAEQIAATAQSKELT